MNIQNMLLNLIVFALPIIALIYVSVGIKLLKLKVGGQFNYFSALIFCAAIYALGYFLSLNSQNLEMMIFARNFGNLGVVFIPTFGLLFISQFAKKSIPGRIRYLLVAGSSFLWIIYITNPIHHLAFNWVDLIKINGFSVASTSKNWCYYLILAYYGFFLLSSMMLLIGAIKKTESQSLKKSYQFILLLMQVSWIAVIMILTGFDKYIDPAAVVILVIAAMIGVSEVKNDLFELEINRWKQTFWNMSEVAFLINGYHEIICMNPAATAYLQLGAAIVVEVAATAFLKQSDGMSRLLPTVASLLGYGISFFLLSKVLDIVPMGISYGIWSGIGIVLVSLMGLLFFGQKLDLAACLGLGLIVLGVLVINFFSGSMPH